MKTSARPDVLLKNHFVGGLLVFVSLTAVLPACLAGSAEVLPEGISRVRIETNFYRPIDERYDDNGKVEDIAADYNTSLDASVFPALGLVEGGFMMPAGSASVGDSIVDFEYDIQILNLFFEHGLTDKLSFGLKLPYWWVKNKVNATVDTSAATVGLNPFLAAGAPDTTFGGAPLVPVAFGGIPLSDDNVQDLLGGGLDIGNDGSVDIPGYGYRRVETRSNNGISDVEVGFRYLYRDTGDWAHAFTGGLRIPTGEIDDPNDLVDFARGDGTWDIMLRLNNDYKGFENTILNLTLKYDIQLPDDEVKRVPDDVNLPITLNQEKVDRDLGDIITLELSGQYKLTDMVSLYASYEYLKKQKDDIKGSMGFAYSSLEDETRREEEVYKVAIILSTLELFKQKKFSIPMEASLLYRDRFDGSDNALKSKYVQLGFKAYF